MSESVTKSVLDDAGRMMPWRVPVEPRTTFVARVTTAVDLARDMNARVLAAHLARFRDALAPLPRHVVARLRFAAVDLSDYGDPVDAAQDTVERFEQVRGAHSAELAPFVSGTGEAPDSFVLPEVDLSPTLLVLTGEGVVYRFAEDGYWGDPEPQEDYTVSERMLQALGLSDSFDVAAVVAEAEFAEWFALDGTWQDGCRRVGPVPVAADASEVADRFESLLLRVVGEREPRVRAVQAVDDELLRVLFLQAVDPR